ncbi:hypothetical protein GV64_05420 [Endozoicomonas elysicola]|uniref:Tyr recombinase domain-containing protein n=2 Tax=Endozoicomonas elysicola TaxID=305900 RepID=A0A081K7X7_9GAMM|nr:hypothetical protein GV64_05420 [Endozoicomonas elysicola]
MREKPYFVYDENGNGLRLRIAPTGVKSFQVMKRIGTKVSFVTVGKFCGKEGSMLMHPEQAQQRARVLYAELAAGNNVNEKKKQQRREEQSKKDATLSAFMKNHYEQWSSVNHKDSEGILKRITFHFGKWFDKPLHELTSALVEGWRQEQLNMGRKPSGINRDLTALRGLLSRALDTGIIDTHPLNKVKQLKVDRNPKPRFLTTDEESRLLAALDKRQACQQAKRTRYNQWLKERRHPTLPELNIEFTDYIKPIVLLAINSGLRRGEIFNLTWHDVNFDQKYLSVEGTGSKTGHTRHVPLNQTAYETLSVWRRQTNSLSFVFPHSETGSRLRSIKSAWREVLKVADLCFPKEHPEYFTFHDLRHAFASKLVMRGASLYDIKELLGHDTIDTTQVYAHLAPQHKANIVALLDEN